MPSTTTSAPTGWFHVSVSPSSRTPRTTPTSGVRYVTVEAFVAPQPMTMFVSQTYAMPVPSAPRVSTLATTRGVRCTGDAATNGATRSITSAPRPTCTVATVTAGRPRGDTKRRR